MSTLFEPFQQNSSDQKYLLVRDDPRYLEEKIYLEKLWNKFEPFADRNFKSELPKQFHPRFWEMYLACTFIEIGFDLVPRKSPRGPDIQINLDGRNLWIDATAPNAGSGEDAVPGYSESDDPEVMEVPEEQIILRLTNSFYEKCQKYEEYVSLGLISKKDAFVIAINGFNVPYIFPEDGIPFIVQAVLSFGPLTDIIDLIKMKLIEEFYEYRGHIQKRSGSDISTKAFQDPAYSFISGILYSTAELWNLPINLGNDFLFVHNPITDQIIDKGWIGRGRYCWVEGDRLRFKKDTEYT